MASNTISTTHVELAVKNAMRPELNKAREDIANFARKTEKSLSGFKKNAERSSKSILQMRRNIDTAFRGLAGSFVIREFVQLSKAVAKTSVDMQLLNQRIKVFTGDSAGFSQAYEAAQLLGVAVENVAMGMGRIVAVGAEMGITTKEARAMTTTFQQLALLSGSSIKESQAAFIQFTQALSANRLSGEELRSVREQAPLVAQAIAKYMGISVGEIKKVAEEGKITAQVMRGAMEMAAKDAAEKFAQLPKSLERQQAEFENAWGRVLLAMDTLFRQSLVWEFFYSGARKLSEGFASAIIPAFSLTDAEIDKQIDSLTRKIQDATQPGWQTAATPAAPEFGIMANGLPGTKRPIDVTGDIEEARTRRWELLQERQRRQMQLNIDAEKKSADIRQQSYEEWFKSLDELEVRITSQKIEPTAMQEFYAKLNDMTESELQKQVQKWAEFVNALEELLAQGMIDPEEYNRRISAGFSEVGGLEEIKVTAEKIFPKAEKEKLSEFAKEAARGMQNAFADFFYDPMKDGLKGLIASFIETMRRVLAEWMATKVAMKVGGWLDMLGGALGAASTGTGTSGYSIAGKRAAGGPVSGGKTYLVGEKGPELFVPGASGKIIPNGMGAQVNAVYNIDARGATTDLVKALPAILAENNRRLMESFRDAKARGAMA